MPYSCDGRNCQARHDLVAEEFDVAAPAHGGDEIRPCWHVSKGDGNYRAEIELLYHDYCTDLEEVAERVKQMVVVPFCDKHNIKLDTGMGTWSLFPVDDPQGINYVDWDSYIDNGWGGEEDPNDREYNAQSKPPEGYAEVRAVLEMHVPDSSNGLFNHMKSYTPEVDDGG